MQLHRVEWTADKITGFWDFMSRHAATDDLYFSKMVGESVIRHVRRAGISLNGRVLDFGCGPGHLAERLLRNAIPCEGVDFSQESVIAAQQRLKNWDGFGGVRQIVGIPTPLESNRYSACFFVETIEHLLDDHLFSTLDELNRLLAPGGHLIVTTPNAEDLEAGTVMCPDCGAVYHRMQHLRSWDVASLAAEMELHGFTTVKCRPVYFTQDTWASRIKATAYKALRLTLPHLLYVGQKSKA